ncbi:hypothetical protein B9T31_04205 [Acinetobacter sp. ANC 4558]|uniref:phage GP46 family protein n=1 Tax=Acinetobacter sp. ANC 4558 TaxID=1977876 RepID=UPI000A348F8F|nr:phage GP46 family protein [Acinetobacter sp. ANC 4558]OTG87707.1 hypothetical protein B9T31_04205 [Acinetobacter sp. ANC 4558]
MGIITAESNKDYILKSLDDVFTQDEVQCVYNRLSIERYQYWANTNLGSRLYLLKRSKDVKRNHLLAKQYAEEALADLIPRRFESLEVTVQQNETGRIELLIEITRLNGQIGKILYFVPVGG